MPGVGLPAFMSSKRAFWISHGAETTMETAKWPTWLDRHVAEPYLIEALWDCEDGVRRIAAGAVPLEGEARTRLRRLRQEAAEDPCVRSTAAERLVNGPR